MQIKQLKIDHWYETTKNIGKCLALNKKSAKFDLDGEVVWLDPKEVKYELPKDVAEGHEAAYEAGRSSAKAPAPAPARPRAAVKDKEVAPSTLAVLLIVQKHLDELAEAWERGVLFARDRQNEVRSSRNDDVRKMLDKVIANEKANS